jgi:hypothetical protein
MQANIPLILSGKSMKKEIVYLTHPIVASLDHPLCFAQRG